MAASTMQAWQKHFGPSPSLKSPQLVTLPIPSCPPSGLLIRIHAAGVCHSDFALLSMQLHPPYMRDQYTLGHEGAGEVLEVGPDVVPNDEGYVFKVGDRVAILSVPGCQQKTCGECSQGLTQICQTGEHYGIGVDGSYAPYIAVQAHAAALLPEAVTYALGAVATDACMTAYHAVVGTGNVQRGETVVILGIGGLGFNGMQIALAKGARVIVRDVRPEVLEEAVRFGVREEDVAPVGVGLEEWVKEKGVVVDTVVDFVGKEDTFVAGQKIVRFGGKLIQVGLLSPTIIIDNFLSVRKHLQILCSYGGTMTDLRECLKLIAKGDLKPQVELGDLADFPKVLDDLHAGKVKSRIALVPKL